MRIFTPTGKIFWGEVIRTDLCLAQSLPDATGMNTPPLIFFELEVAPE